MEFEAEVAIEAYGEEHRRQIKIEERKKEKIGHKTLFVKMFMKKIGASDAKCSNFDIFTHYIAEKGYYYVQFDIQTEIYFCLKIHVPIDPQYDIYVCLESKDDLRYNRYFGIMGKQSILDGKPKSKYLFDYFASEKFETIKQIIRDLYPFIFATNYVQNLPKAYTFLLCCPGTIPKGVDKIIARKILFFTNKKLKK